MCRATAAGHDAGSDAAARRSARRVCFSAPYETLRALPQGARVGTSSLRRQCQLKHARPDLELITLRGNVDTRLRKLDEDQYDAIILAAAGLIRSGWRAASRNTSIPSNRVPAVGQGIIGIECRDDDARNIALVRALNDADAWQCCEAERAFALRLQGSCQSPIAGFATHRGRPAAVAWRRRLARRARDLSRLAARRGRRCRAHRRRVGGPAAEDGAEQLLERCERSSRDSEGHAAAGGADGAGHAAGIASRGAVRADRSGKAARAIAFPAVEIEPLVREHGGERSTTIWSYSSA